jgi:nicotinic acid mononucleotide adenylyltransferase
MHVVAILESVGAGDMTSGVGRWRKWDTLSPEVTRAILQRLRWKSRKKKKAQISLPFTVEVGPTQAANPMNSQPGGVA